MMEKQIRLVCDAMIDKAEHLQMMMYLMYQADRSGNLQMELYEIAQDLGTTIPQVEMLLEMLCNDDWIDYTTQYGDAIVHVKQKKKNNYKLDFATGEWNLILQDWLDYKAERKQSYKSLASIRTCFYHLVNISSNNPKKAKLIVEQSIANNWSGLFPLKNNASTHTNRQEQVVSLENAAKQLLQQSAL